MPGKRAQPADVLRAIAAHVDEYGWPPTLDELAEATGLAAKSCVFYHLTQLEAQGFIRRGRGARMIALTDRGRRVIERR